MKIFWLHLVALRGKTGTNIAIRVAHIIYFYFFLWLYVIVKRAQTFSTYLCSIVVWTFDITAASFLLLLCGKRQLC